MFIARLSSFPPPLLLVLSPPPNFRGTYRYFWNDILVKSDRKSQRFGLDAAAAIAAAAAAPQKGKQPAALQHPLADRALNG
jgi:hypothetical protein